MQYSLKCSKILFTEYTSLVCDASHGPSDRCVNMRQSKATRGGLIIARTIRDNYVGKFTKILNHFNEFKTGQTCF